MIVIVTVAVRMRGDGMVLSWGRGAAVGDPEEEGRDAFIVGEAEDRGDTFGVGSYCGDAIL